MAAEQNTQQKCIQLVRNPPGPACQQKHLQQSNNVGRENAENAFESDLKKKKIIKNKLLKAGAHRWAPAKRNFTTVTMQSRQALLTFVRTTWFSDSVVALFSLKTFFWFAKDSSLTSWKYFSTHLTNIMTSLDIQSSEVSPDIFLSLLCLSKAQPLMQTRKTRVASITKQQMARFFGMSNHSLI